MFVKGGCFFPASGPSVVGYCIVQSDYSPMETNQIALRAGDRVAILDKSSDNRGWWKGKLNGKVWQKAFGPTLRLF